MLCSVLHRYYSTYGDDIEKLDAAIRHTPMSLEDKDDFIIPFVGNGQVGSMVNYGRHQDSNIHIFVESEEADVRLVMWVYARFTFISMCISFT